MKRFLLPSLLLLSTIASSQSFIQAYKNRASQVTQTNINTLLTDFTAFGVKTTGSTANNNAFTWLKNK